MIELNTKNSNGPKFFNFLFIYIIYLIAGPIAIIPLVCVPVVLITGIIVQPFLAKLSLEGMQSGMSKQGVLVETLNGLETIKATGSAGLMRKRFEEASNKQSALGLKTRTITQFAIYSSASIQQFAQVAIIFYGVLNPIVNKKTAQLDDMNKKIEETLNFNQQIKSSKKKIEKIKPQYDQYSTLFHTRAEVEGLYQTLSEFAGMNDLVISKIEKKEIKEVSKADAIAKATGKKNKKKKKKKKGKKKDVKKVENVAYFTIPVDFEITGNFLGYIKFKRQLSLSQKMLNFDKESIVVVKQKDTTGAIKVNGTLTIVGLADEFF